MKTKLVKAAGRFGVRYGQYTRRRVAEIESKQRQRQFCLFCGGHAKRIAKGIWLCRRCGKKFAGHAFYLEKGAPKLKSEKQEPVKHASSKPLKKQETKIKKQKKEKMIKTKAK